jgi:hypothetical protein
VRKLASSNSKIIVYTKYPELFKGFPFRNIQFKKKLKTWEKILIGLDQYLGANLISVNLEMAYERRPRMHLLHAYQEEAHLPRTEEYPIIYAATKVDPDSKGPVRKLALLHTDSNSTKNYRKVFGVDWQVIVQYLKKNGFAVKYIPVENQSIEGAEKASIAGVHDLIAAVNNATIFIGVDSGPSHIAAALRKPALIFFGSVNPLYRHFPNKFNGFFLQQPCEFAGCYHSAITKEGVTCRLVGDEGVPKCSQHSNDYVINMIDQLIEKYVYSSENNQKNQA